MRARNLQRALLLAESSRGGLDVSFSEEIISIIEEIGTDKALKMKSSYVQSSLEGKWKLLWTTEAEIKFFQEWPFSKSCYVGQTIAFLEGKVENTIQFEDGGYFNVLGSIENVNGANAVPFKFSSAEIKNPLFTFTAPPVGAGFFQTLYVNERYRLSKELTRMDWSILERVG